MHRKKKKKRRIDVFILSFLAVCSIPFSHFQQCSKVCSAGFNLVLLFVFAGGALPCPETFLIFTFVAVQFHLIKLDSTSSLTLHRVIFFNG